jgi:hypothetical protein
VPPIPRTWRDTEANEDKEVVSMFERRLKESRPHQSSISYEVADLNRYVDSLPDLVALVYAPHTSSYVPRDKGWIKEAIFNRLKNKQHSRR